MKLEYTATIMMAAFLNPSGTFDWRAGYINKALNQYDSVGFRAPMVHRNLIWLQTLNVDYDARVSILTRFKRLPGGVGSVWPFLAGRFVELPYTLPQDHTLLVGSLEKRPPGFGKKNSII